MLKLVTILTIIVGGSALLGQASQTSTNSAEGVDIEQLKSRHMDTFAELESWVLAESALADIAHDINVKDVVTPLEEFFKSTIMKLSDAYASVTESELGIALELTPENQVLVKSIDPTGRFHHTELKSNDVITGINGELTVDSLDDPVHAVQYYLIPYAEPIRGFPSLTLSVHRDGDSVEVEINNDDDSVHSRAFTRRVTLLRNPTMAWRSDGATRSILRYETPPSVFLLEVEGELGQYFDVEFGVLVLQAPKEGVFKAGDVLVTIEDTAIRAIDHVTKALRRAGNDKLTTRVKRHGTEVELDIERSSVIFRNAAEQMTH